VSLPLPLSRVPRERLQGRRSGLRLFGLCVGPADVLLPVVEVAAGGLADREQARVLLGRQRLVPALEKGEVRKGLVSPAQDREGSTGQRHQSIKGASE
jgi:hypothetical protein